ncbi:MAG: preprotein translocase subunit SecG [Lachnospiraceae bacterium]|jgi:preprotein translocase subunit SecG|nr:preprotein translocase subunit SecG [Lachnospiraceae bacterium]
METLKLIMIIIYAVVCLALVILVMLQSKDDAGASSAVVGGGGDSFYEKNKGRTREGKMKRFTIILGIVFVLLTIALSVVYVM